MPCVLIICPDKREGGRLEELFRRAAARCTDAPLECAVCPAPEHGSGWDVCCVDVSGGAHTAETARAANPAAFLILIAPPELSPMEYLRPSILAAGLLLRPYTDEQAYGLALQALRPSESGQGSFRVETREGAQLVPYRTILYFEAREKKISLVTERGEYWFYDTMDSLEERLPPEFIRCHRGFIVRRDRIARLQLSRGVLYLDGGEPLPVSRTYRTVVKEALA